MANQVNQPVKTSCELVDSLTSTQLRCLHCGSDGLSSDQEQQFLWCQNCNHSYPVIDFGNIKVPFLFENVEAALQDWCARINGFTDLIETEINNLSQQLKNKTHYILFECSFLFFLLAENGLATRRATLGAWTL